MLHTMRGGQGESEASLSRHDRELDWRRAANGQDGGGQREVEKHGAASLLLSQRNSLQLKTAAV